MVAAAAAAAVAAAAAAAAAAGGGDTHGTARGTGHGTERHAPLITHPLPVAAPRCARGSSVAWLASGRWRWQPNFWYERGLVELGQSVGGPWAGLMLLKVMDPLMETPVPLAFAFKEVLFLAVPGSGGRFAFTTLVIDRLGDGAG